MSEQPMNTARPTYVKTQEEANAAVFSGKVIVWRGSYGHTPLAEQYTKEYEDPPFNPDQPFVFADHPFWG